MREFSDEATEQEMANDTLGPEVTITQVRFEYAPDALGIGVAQPRISWTTATKLADWHQTSYEIEVYAADGQRCGQTGCMSSSQSVLVAWPFAALHSRERQLLRVRVCGTNETVSAWSNPAVVEAGLLHPEDW